MSTHLGERFDEALLHARHLHARQRRKGSGIPYIAHLLAVAALVIEHGGTEDEAIAGLLHDAIEDQGGAATREEIRSRFGDAVVEIVDGCTDAETVPKPPWQARKERYIAHMAVASPSVVLVSASDKLHNARAILGDYRCIGEELWSRFTANRAQTLWYYQALLDAYRSRTLEPRTVPLVDELERVVLELTGLCATAAPENG
jgi:GTP pyrophosphokinase